MSGGVSEGTRQLPGWIDFAAAARLGLSDRQVDVLAGIAGGLTNERIGARLGLTMDTVKMHVGRLYRQLGARDRAHAVALAYDKGALRTAAERARLSRRDAA